MTTAIIHLFLALINTAGAFVSFKSYRDDKKSQNKEASARYHMYFTAFFGLFILYHLLLSLPIVIAKNLFLAAICFNLAVFTLFLLLAPMYCLMVNNILGYDFLNSKLVNIISFMLGLIVLIIHTVDFRLPIITNYDLIVWNNNFLGGVLAFLFGALAGMGWTMIYFLHRPKDSEKYVKAKGRFFTFGSIAFSLASVYFIANTPFLVIFAFVFVFLGTICFNVVMLYPKAGSAV